MILKWEDFLVTGWTSRIMRCQLLTKHNHCFKLQEMVKYNRLEMTHSYNISQFVIQHKINVSL